MNFSIVIPIAERDVKLVRRTLPSWLSLGSDDIVLSIDKPATQDLLKAIASVSPPSDVVKIVEVDPCSRWKFNQARARREGFQRAAHDVILTGDIDLIVRRNAIRLTEVVGNGEFGLASCLRVPAPLSASQTLRGLAYLLKEALLPPIFSGLYAFWRPFWRETEDTEIRNLLNPSKESYRSAGPGIIGEDTYLFICMRRKYRCCMLKEIGAIGLARNVEDVPLEQFSWGRYLAGKNTALPAVLVASVLFAYPYLMMGYLYQRQNKLPFHDPYQIGFDLSQDAKEGV